MNISITHEFLPSRPSTLSCIFAAFCCITFTVVGCVGNWLTIIALTRCRRLRNATTAFVVSLAVADFLFCAVCLPLTATRYIYEEWILGNELCNLFPFFFYGNVAASLMSMTAITFNRYVLLCHLPIIYKHHNFIQILKEERLRHYKYCRSKKKRNIPIYFNTNYRTEIKLIPIIMDYCQL